MQAGFGPAAGSVRAQPGRGIVAERGDDYFTALLYDLNVKYGIGDGDFRALLERHMPVIAEELMTKPYQDSDYRMINRCFSRALEHAGAGDRPSGVTCP